MLHEIANKSEYYFVRSRWKRHGLLSLSEFWLQMGDIDIAESFLTELFEHGWTDGFPYKKYQVRARRFRGQNLSAKGRFQKAEIELRRALLQATALGNPTVLWKTYQALGNLLLKQDKKEDARKAF